MARLVTKTSKIMHERRTIPVAGSEPVRLACVSDTHSQPHAKTIERLRELAPTAILHGGDIGDLEVLDALAQVAPVYAVRGNIDTRAKDVPDVLTIDVGALRILLTHIAVYGPKLRGEVAQLAHREKAQLVVCGHSHVPFIGLDKGVTVFNPGSVGPRRFSLPICLGSITISSAGVKLLHINCETGQPWLPPV
ncbi:MAG TPA: metallophosphoesterase family protein [Kofleriaceae bacterium]|nr:metallophosphoesterase family protein [Kofleriaceae bacterium]